LRADHPSRGLRREIVLADVHAGRARQPGDVGAVVHDQLRAKRRAHRHDGGRAIEQGPARGLLRAELEEGRPAFEIGASEIEHGPTGLCSRVGVNDGVQARQRRGSGLGARG